MKYDITHALVALKPGAQWVVRGNDYSGIEWMDSSQTKPTETEVANKIIELDNAEAMRLLRVERNKLLAESDWTQIDDGPFDISVKTLWINYRKQLRDLPATSTPKLDSYYELDLTSVTWPTKP
tara:strand:- start:703 stop:1074 length:372 start_codon:yes stop_codon:yes gene_type:complete